MLFSILRSTEPYLDVYFSEAGDIGSELQEAGFSSVSRRFALRFVLGLGPRFGVGRFCVGAV